MQSLGNFLSKATSLVADKMHQSIVKVKEELRRESERMSEDGVASMSKEIVGRVKSRLS
jgi:hypothetical protein